MQCPVCQSSSQQVFKKCDYWIRECHECKHHFCEWQPFANYVEKVYSNSYFFEGDDGWMPNYLGEKDRMVARYGHILQKHTPLGRISDVGPAAGFILKGLQAAPPNI